MVARSAWKIPYFNIKFFNKSGKIENTKKKTSIKVSNRNLKIYKPMIGKPLIVYDGSSYKKMTLWSGVVGHRLGEFLWTRTAVFHTRKKRLKALEKKNKEEQKKNKMAEKSKIIKKKLNKNELQG